MRAKGICHGAGMTLRYMLWKTTTHYEADAGNARGIRVAHCKIVEDSKTMIEVHAFMTTSFVATKVVGRKCQHIEWSHKSLRKFVKCKVCMTHVGTSRHQEAKILVSEPHVTQAKRTLRP
jgi:hypothetical protein